MLAHPPNITEECITAKNTLVLKRNDFMTFGFIFIVLDACPYPADLLNAHAPAYLEGLAGHVGTQV